MRRPARARSVCAGARRALGALALLAAALGSALPARSAHAFSFALIGDAPYNAAEVEALEGVIDAINADASVRFVLHAGDIKGGHESCRDELLRARFEQLQRLRPALVYTPGDNEWADCHRVAAGAFDPLERLASLRRLFFPDPRRTTGGAPLDVEPQSATPPFTAFVENVLFEHGGVVFATLHVVGSQNGLEPWRGIDALDSTRSPRRDRIDAFQAREAANLAWLDHAFARARERDARAVVLLMQANPRFDIAPKHMARRGFESLHGRLAQRARAWRRPVLLVHGDFHKYLVDRPLGQAPAPVPNLTRVQVFGSPNVGWVRVTVAPDGTFSFEPR
jgi:hypothetical protein